MFSFLRTKPARIVGLEMNSDAIKLLQLSYDVQGYTIENYATALLPPEALVDDKIKRFDWVQSVLRKLVHETHTAGIAAAVALPAHSVIMKRIQLAACLSARECEIEIRANIQRYLPGITEELCFDFFTQPTTDLDYHDVLLVAARAEQVQMYTTLVSSAGLAVKIVDVDSYALLRGALLSFESSVAPAAIIAVCDVGPSSSRFMVFQAQQLLFTQQWAAVDFPEWETQLQRVMRRFVSLHRQQQVDFLLLSGEIDSAGESLRPEFTASIQLANPFKNMRRNPLLCASRLAQAAQRFSLCCGLAVRGASR